MLPHITPYNKANVAKDQPWLENVEGDYVDVFERHMIGHWARCADVEEYLLADLIARADEGDQAAYELLYPHAHFILTEDYRIVQEPNFLRWGMFLELAQHRTIDKTEICKGIICENSNTIGPSFKPEETCVSTVFIGAHEGELFETMIFGGLMHNVSWRTQTLLDAKKQHWKAVDLAHKVNSTATAQYT